MSSTEAISLQDLLGCLAGNVVGVQRVFDADFDSGREQFLTQATTLRDIPPSFVEAIAPCRLIVSTFELRCQVLFSSEKSRGFEVGAVPLNASYHARYSTRTTRYSALHLYIERTPFPGNSSHSDNQ